MTEGWRRALLAVAVAYLAFAGYILGRFANSAFPTFYLLRPLLLVIPLAVLLGLPAARRGFWGATFPIPPEGVEAMPSLHGNVQRPDPVELFGAASVFLPISEMP